jgi:hypothetical protein
LKGDACGTDLVLFFWADIDIITEQKNKYLHCQKGK